MADTEYGQASDLALDAQAILETAPDPDTAYKQLVDAYTKYKWVDPDKVGEVLSQYGTFIKQKFGENEPLKYEETAAIAPMLLSQAAGETDYDKINSWEQNNLNFLKQTKDPGYLIHRNQLDEGIKSNASLLRRYYKFDDSETEQGGLENAIISTAKDVEDIGARAIDGAVGGILDAFGLHNARESLKEYTDPAYDETFTGALAAGLGNAEVALLGGGLYGKAFDAGYLGLQGIGATREQYNTSLQATGDKTRALEAGAMEAGLQAIQAASGTYVFGSAGEALAEGAEAQVQKSITEKIGSTLISAGIQGGVTGAVSAGSKAVTQFGKNKAISDTKYNGVELDAITGFIFGGAAKVGSEFLAKSKVINSKENDPVDLGTGIVNQVTTTTQGTGTETSIDTINDTPQASSKTPVITTEDGKSFVRNDQGQLQAVSDDGNIEHPYDAEFYVVPEVARKVIEADNDPNSSVYTDGEKLYIRAPNRDSNLNPNEEASPNVEYTLTTEPQGNEGNHLVQVNKPKTLNGVEVLSPVKVSAPINKVSTTGAQFTQESKLGARLAQSEGLATSIREQLGDEEGSYFRYAQITNKGLQDAGSQFIEENGLEKAVDTLLKVPTETSDPFYVGLGERLLDHLNEAVTAAEKNGDTAAVQGLSETAGLVTDKVIRMAKPAAQFTQALRLFTRFDPDLRLKLTENYWRRTTQKEVAQELGISEREVQNLGNEVTRLKDELANANKERDTLLANQSKEQNQVDLSIKADEKAISEIESRAEEQAKAASNKEQEQIDLAQQRVKDIETAAADREEKIDTGVTQARERLDKLSEQTKAGIEAQEKSKLDLQKQITETQQKFEEEHRAAQANKIKQAEEAITAEEKRQEASPKKNPEKIAKAKEGLELTKKEVLKLTPEQKRTLENLQRKLTNADTTINNLKVKETREREKLEPLIKQATERKRTNNLNDKEKSEIDTLNKLISDRQERLYKIKPENFISAPTKLQKLKAQRLEKINNREKLRAQKLTPESKAEIDAVEKRIDAIKEKQKRVKSIDEKFQDKLKRRLKNFSPEKQQKLKKLFGLIKNASGSYQEKLILQAARLENEIFNESKVPALKRPFHSFWILNNLSNPATQSKNLIGTLHQILGDTAGFIGTLDGRGALSHLSGILKGLADAPDIIAAELKGQRTFRPEVNVKTDAIEDTTNVASLNKPFSESILAKNSPDFLNAQLPSILKPFRKLGYVGRLMSAVDAVLYRGSVTGFAEVLADRDWKSSDRSKSRRVFVAERLYGSTEQAKIAEAQARREVNQLNELGIDLGGLDPERAIRLRTYEIVEALRPDYTRTTSNSLSLKATLNNKSDTVIGQVAQLVSGLGRIGFDFPGTNFRINPFSLVTAFTKVAANMLDRSLDFSPVGAVRAYNATNALERQLLIGKFIFGSAALGTITAAAKAYINEDNPYFAVFASGPQDYRARQAWLAAGNKPWHVKWGDANISYADSPLALVFASIGGYHDYLRTQRLAGLKDNKFTEQIFPSIVMASIAENFVDQSFMRSLSDVMDALKGPKVPEKLFNAAVVQPTRGYLPARGLMSFVSHLYDTPIQTTNDYWAKYISGYPVLQHIGTKPALNLFGEVVDGTPIQRLDFLSTFYSERVGDPAIRWLSDNSYTIPTISDDIPTLMSYQKESRIAKLGAIANGVLTPDELYEVQTKAGPEIKQKVLEYKDRYGVAGYQDKVQDKLNNDINHIISKYKKEIATR